MKTSILRPAKPSDYDKFACLFLELETDDFVPDAARWTAEMMANTLVAELENRVVGYTFFQTLLGAGYIRHIVVARDVRRAGIGKQLMEAVASKLREAKISEWRLNVKINNTPAIRLYESFGLKQQYESSALKLPWASVEDLPHSPPTIHALPISPDEEAHVEQAMKLVAGQLADARSKQGRILMQLRDENKNTVGAAIFDPSFPGAFPFRLTTPIFASSLLHGLRTHARPEHDFIHLITEDDRPLRDLLVQVGAIVRLDLLHFKGIF